MVRLLFVLALSILLTPALAFADSWRCGDRLVGTGDLSLEVRRICGEPTLVERRTKLVTFRDAEGRSHQRATSVEEWSYRKDSKELLRTLVFEKGRLVSIHVGGRPPVDPSRCERQLFSLGAPSAEVHLACGAPVGRDEWVEYVEQERGDGSFVGVNVTHERWVYDFGPRRFLRIFRFANGRLVEQSTGGYGFAAE